MVRSLFCALVLEPLLLEQVFVARVPRSSSWVAGASVNSLFSYYPIPYSLISSYSEEFHSFSRWLDSFSPVPSLLAVAQVLLSVVQLPVASYHTRSASRRMKTKVVRSISKSTSEKSQRLKILLMRK